MTSFKMAHEIFKNIAALLGLRYFNVCNAFAFFIHGKNQSAVPTGGGGGGGVHSNAESVFMS